ncbi:hypothetical protein KFZ76_12450 [Methylovulum psychrotolerans]|uniref:hypothetical protein n=1 Tax=Methylovulum psychrotolerans TaxID=1704499 RepID=UPI001BFFA879|nr:hypothetical protein [Methylovulum psychrotolerans]MBT9098511.1 hypothetical protein [Methylovulum psychrotolerans]
MKKRLLIALLPVLLTACAEKDQYQAAVLAHIQKDQQLQQEQHLKDYKTDPERLAKCVVDTSANKMPGIFIYDPSRLTAFRNYTKMLNAPFAPDPKKAFEELRILFTPEHTLAEAHANFTESMLDCYSAMVSESEPDAK